MANFRGPEAAGPDRNSASQVPRYPSREGRGQYAVRRSYAALDLGTNNCRMLIARPEGEAFTVVDAFSRIVRLGEGLSITGTLNSAAMDRAVSALFICATKLARRNVHLSRAVATEACRRANNGYDFVDRVARETGILLDIISPEEEARLAVLGCHRMLEPGNGPALIFDIGGGSTELAIVETGAGEPHILGWLSIPWGVVSLSEWIDQNAADAETRLAHFEAMKAHVSNSIGDFGQMHRNGKHPLRLLGTSGTVTTLASVHLELLAYDRRKVDGLNVPTLDMRKISMMLAERSIAERAKLPCIGTERADLVVAGCAILDAIIDIWPSETVGVADRGIREGILRQLFSLDKRR